MTVDTCVAARTVAANLVRVATANFADIVNTGFTVLLIAAVFSGIAVPYITIRPVTPARRTGRRVSRTGIGAKQAGPKDNKYNGGSIDHFLLRVHWPHPFPFPSRLSKSSILACGVV